MPTLRRIFFIFTLLFLFFFWHRREVYASSSFATPSIAEVSNGRVQYARPGFPVGNVSFSGIPFYIPESGNNQVDMQADNLRDRPTSGKISVNIKNAEEAYFLLTSGNTFSNFLGDKIGEIILGFDDGSSLITSLIVGENIREWKHIPLWTTVNTTSSIYVQEVWRYLSSFPQYIVVMDILRVPIDSSYTTKTLTDIEVRDTSFETAGSYDPAVQWSGVSVKYSEFPLILIPGFGACWDYGAMIGNRDGDGWHIPKFVRNYGDLQNTLEDIYSDDEFYTFCYDFRKPVEEIAPKLKEFIGAHIPEGETVDIVGHSMGGLVAREYIQQNQDHRVGQLVTLGSPHEGTIKAYPMWEGGELWEVDTITRAAFEFLIWNADKTEQNPRETVQEVIESVKDLLPTFEFLGRNSDPLKALEHEKNDWLLQRNQDLNPVQKGTMTTIYGHGFSTLTSLKVEDPPWWDWTLDNWPDGKPVLRGYSNEGDGDVLVRSARIDGATVDSLEVNHADLVASQEGVEKILSLLGVSGSPAEDGVPFKNILWFRVHSPAQIRVRAPGDRSLGFGIEEEVEDGEYDEENKLVIFGSSTDGQYEVEVLGEEPGGVYTIDIAQIASEEGKLVQLQGEVAEGGIDKFLVDYKIDKPEEIGVELADEPSELMLLESARLKLLSFKGELEGKDFDQNKKNKAKRIIDKITGFLEKAKSLMEEEKNNKASYQIEKAIVDLYYLQRLLRQTDEEIFLFVNKRIEDISQDLVAAFLIVGEKRKYGKLKIGARIRLTELKLKILDGLFGRVAKKGMVGENKAVLFVSASDYLAQAREALKENNLPLAHIASKIARRISLGVEIF